MDKKTLMGSALIGLVAAGGIAFAVTAQTPTTQPDITEEDAVAIALLEVPGEVQEVELDREDGIQVYEIEIRTADGVEMEVEIAASTGEVLGLESEDDACDRTDDA